ncbi:MAG: universal stress protein [Alphaproteobacteria bacterium]|nr:universal stress protein [Alphaproteobacteria bacterium]
MESQDERSPAPREPEKAGAETDSAAKGRTEHGRVFLIVVDETPEYEKALRFAARRARRTQGRVALLHVMPPLDFQNFGAVQDLMANERRQTAERLLQRVAAKAQEIAGSMPIIYLREGSPAEQLLKLIAEEPQISVLVLGGATGREGPGPLVAQLTGRMIGKLRIPITIVPGHIPDADIDAVT